MNNSLGLQKKTPKSLTFITVIYEDVSIRDEEKCCVCGDFEPKALRDKPYIEIVNWAQCVVCCHSVHLSYCVPEKVVRKDTEFVCPHCKQQWKLRNILLYFVISCWLFNIDNYLNRILYSNHQLHTSLNSQHNHIQNPVSMPSIRI
jgi:hypothetical protein